MALFFACRPDNDLVRAKGLRLILEYPPSLPGVRGRSGHSGPGVLPGTSAYRVWPLQVDIEGMVAAMLDPAAAP